MTNIFNFDLQNLHKLFKKGNIVKLYHQMYALAEELAIHDMDVHMTMIDKKSKEKPEENKSSIEKWVEKVFEYRDQRFEYHFNQMKELLKMKIKEDEKDK